MTNDLAYWREVHRTSGWRGVRWCLNCLYGPRAWRRIAVGWWRRRRMGKMFRQMTSEDRAELLAALKGLSYDK